MQKHRTHQIDDLAQRVLPDALAPTWVLNEQHNDYGKDYLVEVGEDDGDLTGSSFYVQLKGQEKATISADGTLVKYSLESKYANYYFDKIKDLPVFLVVVDVNQERGWWLFLQPVLEADQTWRKQGSITLSLSAATNITDTDSLREAVDEAKKWMRLHHPESIHESVVAHKERIDRTDPRFDVAVSLVNDKPRFKLLAKEEVLLTFDFSGDPDEIGTKVNELIDKGALVAFKPGEVRVTGSKLFEDVEETGCSIQAAINLTGTFTIACRDSEGGELARLSDVPGRYTGGRRELWFEGELVNSPLTIKLGPLAQGVGGSVKLDLNLDKWDGQPLSQLAYFDRLYHFFHTLPHSTESEINCQQDGNQVFSVTLPIQKQPFAGPLAHYLGILSKARKVARHFDVNPTWTVESFDQENQENAEQLYAIFFEDGWRQPMPNVRLTADCIRRTFNSDAARQATKPGFLKLISDCKYMFLSEEIEVGRLVQDYSNMSIRIMDKKRRPAKRKAKGRKKKGKVSNVFRRRTVKIALVGTKKTVMRISKEEEPFSEPAAGLTMISERTKVTES